METNELKLEFMDTTPTRDELIEAVKEALYQFLPELWNKQLFSMTIIEMVKNIYDHADGKGHAHLHKDTDSITFEVKDYSSESFTYESLVNNSKKCGNGMNFGIGLYSISTFAQELGIELSIDTSRGFTYKGIWHYNRDE